ncbi:MAG: SUF system NifU family Fe-S cluster assembly protein [Ardenticatenia bacterium]|nr:SUF system NifU family Fe-S cluster assembly protein [Ardenticatenia bacterium]
MDDFYRENVLDHYRHPHNKGELAQPTHTHQDDNPLCGDVIRIDLHANENDVIDQVRFSGEGCAISLASASMLTEMLEGRTLEEAKQLSKEDLLAALGIELGPARRKCALLSLKVLKGAVDVPSSLSDDEDEDW